MKMVSSVILLVASVFPLAMGMQRVIKFDFEEVCAVCVCGAPLPKRSKCEACPKRFCNACYDKHIDGLDSQSFDAAVKSLESAQSPELGELSQRWEEVQATYAELSDCLKEGEHQGTLERLEEYVKSKKEQKSLRSKELKERHWQVRNEDPDDWCLWVLLHPGVCRGVSFLVLVGILLKTDQDSWGVGDTDRWARKYQEASR